MSNPITPTVGRVVLVRGPSACSDKGRDVPAIITRVWGENCVNLQVMRDAEAPVALTSVMYDDSEHGPEHYAGWRWMPYQKAVAAGEIAPTKHA